jgi:hypothetical protein
MSALEQEIYQKFRLLDKESQQRVIAHLELEAKSDAPNLEPMPIKEWLKSLEELGEYIHNKYGPLPDNSVDLLNEAREERMNDLMGGN